MNCVHYFMTTKSVWSWSLFLYITLIINSCVKDGSVLADIIVGKNGKTNEAILKIPSGSISFSSAPSASPASSSSSASASTSEQRKEYKIGNFVLKVDTNDQKKPYFELTHSDQPDETYWRTIPGQSFILAAYGNDVFNGDDGLYFIDDFDLGFCGNQTIENIRSLARGSQLEVTGKLSNDLGCDLKYSFVLKAVSKNQLEFSVEHSPSNTETSMTDDSRADTGQGRNSQPKWNSNREYTKTFLTYYGASSDRIHGFGMQYTHLNLQGESIRVYTRENGLGRAILQNKMLSSMSAILRKSNPDLTTSIALAPFYFTSSLFSMFLKNNEYSVFDFHGEDTVKIKVVSNRVEGRFIYAKDYLGVIEEYTSYTGRMKPLPDWTQQGAIAGIQGGSERTRELVNLCEEKGIPLAGVWLQDWVGNRPQQIGSVIYERLWWNWESDRKLYPDWSDLVQELKKKKVRTLAYVNSFLADPSTKPSGFRRNLFEEARANDYLVKIVQNGQFKTYFSSSGPGIQAGLVDLFNPEAYQWLKKVIIEQMVKSGVDGAMFDFGEYFPPDTRLPKDQKGRHNEYVELWAKLSSEIATQYKDFVPFHRSGFTRSPGYVKLFWTGDHFPDWDDLNGIKSSVISKLTSGMAGYSLTHSDVGGYFNVQFLSYVMGTRRSAELLLRWMEVSVFSAMYRTHEGSIPMSNAQFYNTEATINQFKRMSLLFKAMAPYRRELMQEAAQKGYPLIRAMLLQFPNDENTAALKEQFMFGSDVLVAPALNPAAKKVKVYLPKGDWQHLWSGIVYQSIEGETVELESPIGEPIVLLRYPVTRSSLRKLIEFAKSL